MNINSDNKKILVLGLLNQRSKFDTVICRTMVDELNSLSCFAMRNLSRCTRRERMIALRMSSTNRLYMNVRDNGTKSESLAPCKKAFCSSSSLLKPGLNPKGPSGTAQKPYVEPVPCRPTTCKDRQGDLVMLQSLGSESLYCYILLC